MKSHTDIINQWPDEYVLAKILGVTPPAVRNMRNRDSIPGKYWKPLVQNARRRKLDVTLEQLAQYAWEGKKGGA